MDDELLDLVNRSDEVTGRINRMNYSDLLKSDMGYIRTIDLFILNSERKVYIPTRTSDKTIASNGYDFSVGGHVESGQDYLSTVIRESEEELNLTLSEGNIELVDKTIFDDIKYIRYLYLYRSDNTPQFNPNDFVAAECMLPEDVVKSIGNGHPAKSTLLPSVALLVAYLARQ